MEVEFFLRWFAFSSASHWGGTTNLRLLKLISLGFFWDYTCSVNSGHKISGQGSGYQFKYKELFPPSSHHQGRDLQTSLLSLLKELFFYPSLRPQSFSVPTLCEGLCLLLDSLSWTSFLCMVQKLMVCLKIDGILESMKYGVLAIITYRLYYLAVQVLSILQSQLFQMNFEII